MIKKINLVTGLATTSLLISGCSGVSVEEVQKSTELLEASFDDIIKVHDQLSENEVKMNEQFKEVLAQDEELVSIQDESASVVKNINERETLLEDVKKQTEIITEQADFLNTYDGDKLSSEILQEASTSFSAFTTELNNYYESYQNSLTTQLEYLNNIAADDSSYEDFINGLESVNKEYISLQEATVRFDNNLADFEKQLKSVQTEVANASEDSASQTAGANSNVEKTEDTAAYLTVNTDPLLTIPDKFPQKFVYDSPVDIEYPEDGVKGVYVTAHSAGGEKMDYLTELLNSTELNSMVIDVKDDYGNVTLDLNSDDELVNEMTNEIVDAEALMSHLEENDIYPIARIVVFKDSHLAEAKPEWSFTHNNGEVWANRRGESFVNPYLKEVWDYNVEIAIQAAKLGFKDIQFDYVRFPEGFETRDRELNYGHGHYGSDAEDVINMEYRNQAVMDFVAYAREQLQPYGVDLSVDIFGYAAVVRETPGIGQSFPGISSEVDVISSMIYPSHWGPGNLDVAKPDLDPYKTVYNYAIIENEIMEELGEDAPVSRPWIQDFTASYLGAGNYKNYGAQEVTEQIKALHDNGITEYLLWNAGNTYSNGATYSFD